MSPPPAHSPSAKDDDEVVSQRTFPGQGEVSEVIRVAPKDDSSAAGHMGEKAPMGTGNEGQVPLGSQSDTIPETYTAPEFSERPSPKGGGVPVPPVTFVQPEAPDNLLEALRGASIVDEHRALMGAVIEKIQSVESGLNGACISLIKGFEVCFMRFRRVSWYG